MIIKVTCNIEDRINFNKLNPIQGNLKSLSKENYEKLKRSIIKHGIHSPCYVWQDPNDGGELKILDGHQRCRAYGQMEKEGFSIPLIPIVKIEAVDIYRAKEILLTLVSQYGHVEDQGLYEYMEEAKLEVESLIEYDIPGIIEEKFKEEYYEYKPDDNKESNDPITEKQPIKCPRCGEEFIK